MTDTTREFRGSKLLFAALFSAGLITTAGATAIPATAAAQAPAVEETDETGTDETGTDETGTDETGTDETGTDETDAAAGDDAAVADDDADATGDDEAAPTGGAAPAPRERGTRQAVPPDPDAGAPDVDSRPLPRAPDEPGLTCAARARAAAADAVVRVRSADQWGAGFVYDQPNRVITSFSLLERGRPITVVARDGTEIGAQVLARDDQYDLAVLELAQPVPGAEPLSPAPETSARLGAEVVSIGHPYAGVSTMLGERGAGLLRWSVTQGTLGAVNDAGLQADLALTEGHAGAPLLDCEGRVLGMVTGPGRLDDDLGLVARIGHADQAIAESAGPGDFLGDLKLRLGLGAGLLIDEEGRTAAGLYLTLGATLFDRISWMNRVGLFMGGLDDPTEELLSQDRQLIRITSLLGYRFFIDIAGFTTLYVVPAGGISIQRESIDTTRVAVVPGDDPTCVPSATMTCATTAIIRESTEDWIFRPAVGLTFYFGNNFGIGYTLEIGLETASVETHHVVRLELFL